MSELLQSVSPADITRWQIAASSALSEVLQLGARYQLPPLYWGIAGAAGLQGVVPDSFGERDERVEWQRWVDALQLTIHASVTLSGIEHAKAFRTYTTASGLVTTVTVRAELHTDVPLSPRAVTPYWQRQTPDTREVTL
jgi:hypothetical protein